MKAHLRYTGQLSGRIDPPSSKNYTTRYLLVAALAEGESLVRFPAISDDAAAMVRCLRDLGATIEEEEDREGRSLRIAGFGRRPRAPGRLDPGNAGAVLRLLIGVGALLPEIRFETTFGESLGQRPHGDLLDALGQLGLDCEAVDGRLPLVLRGGPPIGGPVRVSGARSSQYLSALLFLAPLLQRGMTIEVTGGLVSKPLVRTTLEVMRQAGIEVEAADDLLSYRVPGGQVYLAREYRVNGDFPSAAAVLAAGAVTESRIAISRLYEDSQGERAAIPILRAMGARVDHEGETVRMESNGRLRGVEFDGDQATDMVLAMVAAACLAEGTSRFYNVANLRLKECDRIAVPALELGRLGVAVRTGAGELSITGRPEGYEGGIEVSTHHDHRVAQMLAIVGLRCRRGLTILDAENVSKSYPDFFADLARLGADLELVD